MTMTREVNTRVPGSQRPATDDDFKNPGEWQDAPCEGCAPEVGHDGPHSDCHPCDGCCPNTSSYTGHAGYAEPSDYGQSEDDEEIQVETKNLAPVFTQLNTRTTAYHFGPLSFRPGRDGIRDVLIGDPGIAGVISVKVVYRGTGKRPSIFTVPVALMILEEEELPIEIISSLKGLKHD